MSVCVLPPFSRFYPPSPITHTHTHRASNHLPPIVCPSNDSQGKYSGKTALAKAIENDGYGEDGCAECAALLRAAGAQ
jgi:hypothetical protein